MVERWEPVVGYEGVYAISDRGRVRRIVGGPGARVGHILQAQPDRRGYFVLGLFRDGHRRTRKIHHLVTEAFLGPRPAGSEVNHKNGNTADNRLRNLEYMTRSENMKHRCRVLGHGLGENHSQAKVTAAVVLEIRQTYAQGGITHRALAKRHGVTYGCIGPILRRETWTHVA